MTENRMKNLAIEISRLRSKYNRLKSEAEVGGQRIDGMPSGGCTSDKVGTLATELVELSEKIKQLEAEREDGFRRLSRDVLEQNCYYLKYKLHYSWRRIASITMRRPDYGDVVRMKVKRYFKGFVW